MNLLKPRLLGLDVGTRIVKGIKLKKKKDRIYVDRYFYHDLAESEKDYPNESSPTLALGAMIEMNKLKGSASAIGLNDQDITNLIFKRTIERNLVNSGHLQGWDHWHFLNLAERHCGLELVEWGYDATVLPVVSHWIYKIFGTRAAVWMETGPFRWLMPNQGISIIGIFRPKQ